MKLLSIVIPTYNMELLLPACLDSLVGSACLPALDIVVVNDGSSDGSKAVAERYSARYANSVRVIDKPNGNYGSTINAALATLQGRFVKILDADDTFDTEALESYVAYLNQVSDADMVVGPYVEIDAQGVHRVDYNLYSKRVYGYGVPYTAEQVFEDGSIAFFAMHGIAYRTELLQTMGYRQSEGISYTDQQWCFFPVFGVQTIAFTDIALYRYNLTRPGQTMDNSVQLRSLLQLFEVVKSMALHLDNYGAELSVARYHFLLGVVVRRMQSLLRKYLLEIDDSSFEAAEFERVVAELKSLAPQSLTVPVNNLLRVDLLGCWQRRHRRYPLWVRRALMAADRAMQRVYRLLFN